MMGEAAPVALTRVLKDIQILVKCVGRFVKIGFCLLPKAKFSEKDMKRLVVEEPFTNQVMLF